MNKYYVTVYVGNNKIACIANANDEILVNEKVLDYYQKRNPDADVKVETSYEIKVEIE